MGIVVTLKKMATDVVTALKKEVPIVGVIAINLRATTNAVPVNPIFMGFTFSYPIFFGLLF